MRQLHTKHFIQLFIWSIALLLIPLAAAQASGSLAMSAISPGVTVSAGTQVTFTVTPTGFTSPTYLIDDNFGGTSLTSSKIDASGQFSWTPTSNDIGTHSFTISASDGVGNAASIPVTISISQPTLTLGSPQPSATVSVASGVSFSSTAIGFTNPTYSINDAFGGTITSANINSSGFFSWTPAASDSGDHVITVTASDASGHSANASRTITVNAAPTLSITSLSPGSTVGVGQAFSFSVVQTGMTSPTYAVTDSLITSSVTNTNMSSSGQFSWTPTTNDTGTHNLFVVVTDTANGRSLSITQTVSVLIPNLSIQGATPSLAAPGSTVAFYVTSNGYSNPTYAVSDSFSGSTVTSANISASGNFSWVPTTKDIGGHTFTITMSDAYSHNGTLTQTFLVALPTVVSTTTTVSTGTSPAPVTTITNTQTQTSLLTSDLAKGSSGNDVSLLQALLLEKGFFAGPINGSFGPMTEAAVKRFQVAQGLSPVGAVGPQTRAALNKTSGGTSVTTTTSSSATFKFTRPLSLGSEGTEVTELQKRLTVLGHYSGPISGYFGTMTRTAVKLFQSKHNLEQLGNVGPGTRAALNVQ